LRVLVDTTVAPSRTWAWLPMHSGQTQFVDHKG